MVPHMRVFGWLTLLICLGTTGDLVHDLAFEEPNVATDDQATADEPDNAAEHVLMPSPRADSSATDAVTVVLDLETLSVVRPLTGHTALKTTPSRHPPPRHAPIAFSVPLRI